MGEQIKKMTFVNAIAVRLFLFQLSFACNSALYFNMGKKPSYDPLLASSSAFMTDSLYLGTMQMNGTII